MLTPSNNVRIYKTKNFTVSVEHHTDRIIDSDLAQFKWVRIFANQNGITYKSGSQLLLGCESGSKPSSQLIKMARISAQNELERMQALASSLLTLKV
ncbi:hypothetical protein OTK49_21540 [Vibrio coralliirubri]|uniref:hypothetical protein n=1 Tax=Vibrio coralliirubri TaxID=1516159 RepID=UPI0022846A2E|nr:hypothetical protein [Vibrio coralliirubri]MCY9865106.1 hypothetical protein [Vibrio coralliirubri]